MITQAVVLAAGKGSRIRANQWDRPKPLHEVAGVPLVTHTLLALAHAGIDRVVLVVGFMAEAIRRTVEDDADCMGAGLQIEFAMNRDYELSNGVSVLAAQSHITGPFVLSMADHLYQSSLPAAAAMCDMARADLYLCVDRRVDQVYDIDDATKVATHDDRIVAIGKTLDLYDCIDCGVFAVSPALLDTLSAVYRERGDCSLSDGVQRLAENHRARVVDIGDAFWQDVDTQAAKRRAEREWNRLRLAPTTWHDRRSGGPV